MFVWPFIVYNVVKVTHVPVIVNLSGKRYLEKAIIKENKRLLALRAQQRFDKLKSFVVVPLTII
jgi:hypothetical protein